MSGRRTVVVAVALFGAAAAVLVLGNGFDGTAAEWVEGWRTCTLHRFVAFCADWLRVFGVALAALALGRHLTRGPQPRLQTALGLLVALGAGSLLVEGTKRFVDRPRPGAEILGKLGHSLPSGHVANTILCGLAVLFLWRGRAGVPLSRTGWIVLAATGTLVALARVYTGHHWPSDVLATAALTMGYGLLAMRHPEPRARLGAVAGAALLAGTLFALEAAGVRVRLPTGGLAPVVARMSLPADLAADALRGKWAGGAGKSRDEFWLLSPVGKIRLHPHLEHVDQIRLVVRPGWKRRRRACRELRVSLNGAPLGRRLLHLGLRAYVFRVGDRWRPDGPNVLGLEVRRGQRGGLPRPPLAAFRELTLHARDGGGRATIRGQ